MSSLALVRRNPWIFFIIFMEGYVVLATEILTMRQLIPFVGNGIEIVSIVIASVLIPLAWGYYDGSRLKPIDTVRPLLSANFTKAACFLSVGLSYFTMVLFFTLLESIGIHYFLWQTLVYVTVFIIYPIFLLAQTLPLLSHYLSTHHPALVSGSTLFFSTIGSFLGSVFTTMVLMNYFGVNVAVVVVVAMVGVMILCLKEMRFYHYMVAIACLFLSIFLNNQDMMKLFHVVATTPYSQVRVLSEDGGLTRRLSINHSNSAVISALNTKKFEYIRFIEEHFIHPSSAHGAAKSILVVGSGGFTLGLNDHVNHYTFIDIDAHLKKIVEREFLKRKLAPNVTFIPQAARLFLRQDKHRYDLIVLDAYSNIASLPAQLVTKEFFASVKQHLNPGGIVVFNAIVSPNFADVFSARVDMTFRSIFPFTNREVIGAYDGWVIQGHKYNNVMYSYFDRKMDQRFYSDNRTTLYQDKRARALL